MSDDNKKFDPFGNSFSNDANDQTSMLGDSDLQRELLAAFKSELDEYLQALNSGLLRLEQGESSDQLIQEIFRSAHSMKGTSGAFGLTKIQKVSHALENLFGAVRSRRFAMDKLAFDLCYEGLDIISHLMEMELAGRETPPMVEVNFAQSIEILLNAGSTMNTDPLPNQPTQARQAPTTAELQKATEAENAKTPPQPFIIGGNVTDAEVEEDTLVGKKLTDSSKIQQPSQPVSPPQPYYQPPQPTTPQYSSSDISSSQTSLIGDSDLQEELLAAFKSELDEYLQALNSGLLRLEQGESSDQLIQEIFRSAHSMKGTSGAFGLTKIQKVSHALENLFGAVRSKKFVMDKVAFDLCYEGLDTINKLMEMELAGIETPPMVEVHFAQYVETLLNAENKSQANQANNVVSKPFIVGGDVTDAEVEEETLVGKKLTDSSKIQQPSLSAPVKPNHYQTIDIEVIAPEPEPVRVSQAVGQTAMLGDSDLQRELLAAFKSELDEYLQTLNSGLLRLEQGESSDQLIQEIFRSAHSMKGTSGAFGLTKIQKVSHALENLFGAVRSKKFVMDKVAFDLCYEGLDSINKLVEMELAGIETPPMVEVHFAQRIEEVLNRSTTPLISITPVVSAPPALTPNPVAPPIVAPANNYIPNEIVKTNQNLQKTETATIAKPSEKPQELAPIENIQLPISNKDKPTVLQTKEPQSIMKDEKGPLVSQAKTEFIRIPLVKIDHLMSDVGELIITRSRYEQRVKELEVMNMELLQALKEMLRVRALRRKIGKTINKSPELEKIFSNLEFCEGKLKTVTSTLQTHTEDVSNDDLHLELIVSSIQREVQGLRMLPIETLFEPLRRRVRDISRHQDKTVTLELQGGETELDRQLIEAMRDPLVHLITNSIDHGLETPEQRKQVGKPPTGSLRLSAGQRGNQIIIEISDDGRGIDFEKVKQKALSAGLFTERELASFTEDEIVSLIFRAGFSTKAAVTEFSGRGVGLDVVKVNVEKLQGQIEVHTVKGKGSTFKITLPLTLSTQRVLLVKAASQLFALPVNAIDRLMSISVDDVFTVGAKMTIAIEGKPVSLIHLSSLLNVADADLEAKQEHVVMVLAMGSERAAFVVDEALGEQEVVVKALGKPLRKMKNIAGGAILGDGSVMLLLNPSDLLRAAKGSSRIDMKFLKKEEKTKSRSRILVIDDSITTRTLEKNILEMAGFEVLLAKDGLEGLEMSKSSGCNLVLSDIDMPKLNGIDLTTEIKNDPKLKHLPVVLISSLDTPEIKMKVAQSGADAFIVKGQFDQHQFLQVVRNMLNV